MTKLTMNAIRNTTNKTLATQAAVPAIPPKPRTAAMIAMTRKVKAQLNMTVLTEKVMRCTEVDITPPHQTF